ncbi:DEAD/DEAH box helicase [Bacillus suaedaesalsae]|uniref:DEAD/DEAH box helicase n=1 Tax=Bacillus suaedaesalsae TaxID=2810349 RepID=A0ABS2DLY4_9BACI|nr:DEAD/DEAH box helicase [Bacillus suaedaesalsae]MBM6619493.1 DEAD/DEAH box helicase [Bacillus suaedaesalsae]
MNMMNGLYEKAKNETIDRVYEDITRYLENHEQLPTYEQYLRERGQFIVHLWLNTWVNVASSQTPVKDRKAFLVEKGLDVEDVTRKQLNVLFKNEIREYRTFNVIKWLDEQFSNNKQEWQKTYEEARDQYIQRERRRKEVELRQSVIHKLENEIEKLLTEYFDELYVHVRYEMALHITKEMERSGYEPSSINTNVESYIEDSIEEQSYIPYWKRKTLDWEEIENQYQMIISDYLFNLGPKWFMEKLGTSATQDYKKITHQELTLDKLKAFIIEPLYDLSYEFLDELKSEFIEDLRNVTKVPFTSEQHLEMYYRDLENQELRYAEEQAELQRRKEEHERMMEDVFGKEYSPSASRTMKFVLHVGETNTGKTYHALQRMKEAQSGLYLAPLRLLALEVFDKLNNEDVPCSLKTGEEEKITNGASHLSSTVEMFYEKDYYEVIVIDEAQMISDKDRGYSWYKAITKANATEVHIIGSLNSKEMLLQLLGEAEIELYEYVREIPLEVEAREFSLKQTKKGDAIVCFSRSRVLETASSLKDDGYKVSMIYGSMPPETRKKQMKMFVDGETTVIVATDAIGMGLNLPIRRIVFLENEKFDGTRRRTLSSQEVKQIAGRAGRKGIYDIGKVAFSKDISHMTELLQGKDESLHTFAIAPTSNVLERYEKYSRNLGEFFELWKEYKNPAGTRKAPLIEARDLYESIKHTEIAARLSLKDLYSFINMPFSASDPALAAQWKKNMYSIIDKSDLPEPVIKTDSLEELELSYKSVGLHLLFLYRLERRTETVYWERVREDLSNSIHEMLKTGIKIPTKTCRTCGAELPKNFRFMKCEECFNKRPATKRSYFHR